MEQSNTLRSNVLEWLDANPNTADILLTARMLIRVQAYLNKLLPPALAPFVQLAQIDGPEIRLIVPSPAYATRLHQISDTIIKKLSEQNLMVDKLSIRVDASLNPGMTKSVTRRNHNIDQQGLEEFAKLKSSIAPSPLADAIERLLEHHAN